MSVISNPQAYEAARKAANILFRRFPNLGPLWRHEDFESHARVLYLKAMSRWDGRGELPRWVYHQVRLELLHFIRVFLRRQTKRKMVHYDPRRDCRTRPAQDLSAKLSELSDAAQEVATLVFDFVPPPRRRYGRDDMYRGRRVAGAVRKRLRRLGWDHDRIGEAFQELSEVL